MTHPAPHVVIIGATNMDRVHIHEDLDELPPDGKFRAHRGYSGPGGGGANMALNLKELANRQNIPMAVTLFTRVGREHHDYALRHEVLSAMESAGVDTRDLVANQDFRMDDNYVISHKRGRFISLDAEFGKALKADKPLELAHQEPQAYDTGAKEQVLETVRGASLLILTHPYPEIAEAAAIEAHSLGIPVIMDYAVTKYDSAWKYLKTLAACDYIFAPGEARLPDMVDGSYKNGNGLFSKLITRYPDAFIAVSDGTDPVKIHSKGRNSEMPVMQYPVVDPLGTGDARTASFALFLLKGDEPEVALKRASRIASFSVQYLGRQWLDDVQGFMNREAVFTNPAANDTDEQMPGMTENYLG